MRRYIRGGCVHRCMLRCLPRCMNRRDGVINTACTALLRDRAGASPLSLVHSPLVHPLSVTSLDHFLVVADSQASHNRWSDEGTDSGCTRRLCTRERGYSSISQHIPLDYVFLIQSSPYCLTVCLCVLVHDKFNFKVFGSNPVTHKRRCVLEYV
jgi:hypothetical protein